MSPVNSMRASRGGQRDHLHPKLPFPDPEVKLPGGFKQLATHSGGRRQRGFVRSEVKKSMGTSLSDTINSNNFEGTSTISPSTKPIIDLPSGDLTGSRKQALETCDSTHAQKTMKTCRSETSSFDIIVNSPAGHQDNAAREKSSCLHGVETSNQTAPAWDNSGHDVEKLGPLYPPISFNNLPRRHPRGLTLKNAFTGTNASSNGMSAGGSICNSDTRPSRCSVVTPRELQRTDVNFPSLPVSQKHLRELKVPVYQSFPSRRLISSSSTVHQAGSKHIADDLSHSSTSKLSTSRERVAGKTDVIVGKMDAIENTPEATIAPHLRLKPGSARHQTNKEAESSIQLHVQQTRAVIETPSKPDVKGYPTDLPPLLVDAWNKSTLTTSGTERDAESLVWQCEPAPSVSIDSLTTVLVPVEDEQINALEKTSRNETQAELHKSLPDSSSDLSEHEQNYSSQALHIVQAAQDTEQIQSHSAQASNLRLGLRGNVSRAPALSIISVPNSVEDGDKVKVANGVPKIECKTPRQCAMKTGNAASNQVSGLSHHASASARLNNERETPTKDDSSPFTWISGKEDNGLLGWDKKMKPAPVGEEWAMRDAHDSTDATHKALIENWAHNQLEGQTSTPLEIDVNSPEFLNGQIIVGEDIGMQQGIEASLHDAIPDRTTLYEPKRQLNTEEIIQEHIAVHGLPSSGEPPSKLGKRGFSSGETKAERRARLEFARAAERSLNLEPNEHTPEANIYMRPAESKDIPMITDLHNTFIANESVATHFVKPSDESLWRGTLEACLADCCPFFVAIISQSQARAMQVKDVRRGKFESVVGFAYGTDFGAPDNAYRITLEIEIWVDPRHQHKGIGKTLLDRMLACLDPMYAWKDPVPFLDMGDKWKWMGGGHRVIQTLIVSLLYSNDDKEALAWKKEWLMRSNFQNGGVIPNIARKSRKQINLCQMYYTTGHDVSHIFQ